MPERMHIGALARAAEVTIRTIKYYEELGLLTPAGKTEGGFRVFTDEDVARVEAIRRMRAVGLSLHTIKEVLTLRQTISGLGDRPLAPSQVEKLIAGLEDRRRHVDENVRRLRAELTEGVALQQDLERDIEICRARLKQMRGSKTEESGAGTPG